MTPPNSSSSPTSAISARGLIRRFATVQAVRGISFEIQRGEIFGLVGPDGADKVIDTTGVKGLIELAYEMTARKGRCILVGVPHEKVEIYTLPLHFDKVLKGSEGGQCQPARDIPRLVRLAKAGRIDYDGIVTHEFALDGVNDAIALMRGGTSGRIVLNIS